MYVMSVLCALATLAAFVAPACGLRSVRDGPLVVVLDMDDTLLHFEPTWNNVTVRPHTAEMLKYIVDNPDKFSLIFFTAGRHDYADPLLDKLLQIANVSEKDWRLYPRLYRDSCGFIFCIKDLRRFVQPGEDLSRIVLVDDRAFINGFCQIDNAIQVPSYTNESDDGAMLELVKLLEELQAAPDVRMVLKGNVKSFVTGNALRVETREKAKVDPDSKFLLDSVCPVPPEWSAAQGTDDGAASAQFALCAAQSVSTAQSELSEAATCKDMGLSEGKAARDWCCFDFASNHPDLDLVKCMDLCSGKVPKKSLELGE